MSSEELYSFNSPRMVTALPPVVLVFPLWSSCPRDIPERQVFNRCITETYLELYFLSVIPTGFFFFSPCTVGKFLIKIKEISWCHCLNVSNTGGPETQDANDIMICCVKRKQVWAPERRVKQTRKGVWWLSANLVAVHLAPGDGLGSFGTLWPKTH